MPQISKFFGIVIWMFYNDHNPPHFHANYGEFEGLFRIDDVSILSGSLPPRALGLVTEWATIHKQELHLNWELSRKGESLHPINPLQ